METSGVPTACDRRVQATVIHLPVVDVSNVTSEVGRQMLDAAVRFGFFYVDSRNIPEFTSEIVDRTFLLVGLLSSQEIVQSY